MESQEGGSRKVGSESAPILFVWLEQVWEESHVPACPLPLEQPLYSTKHLAAWQRTGHKEDGKAGMYDTSQLGSGGRGATMKSPNVLYSLACTWHPGLDGMSAVSPQIAFLQLYRSLSFS